MEEFKQDPDKPTILIVSEDATVHSGLARVVRSIFVPLHETGKYNIAQVAWAGPGREIVPWPIFRTERQQDEHGGVFTPEHDKYAKATFSKIVQDVKPEVCWSVGDPWMLDHLGTSDYRSLYDLVIYTCIDSEPLSRRFHDIYKKATVAVTFGKWPHRVLLESAGIESEIIPHGVDLDTFKFDMSKRLRFRAELQASPEHIVLGTVARNQPRKNLPSLFPVLHALRYGRYITCNTCGRVTIDIVNPCNRKIRKEATECRWCRGKDIDRASPDESWLWYYHGALLDIKGWDLVELIDRYGLRDCVRTNPFLHPLVGNMDIDLAGIYSAMDIFVLPTLAEGFGLPILESLACGRPVVLPNYSAYVDWAPAGGLMVDYTEFVEHGVHANRAIGLTESWIEHLLTLKNPVVRDELGRAGRKKAEEYGWGGIVKLWEKLFDSVLSHRSGGNWRRATRI